MQLYIDIILFKMIIILFKMIYMFIIYKRLFFMPFSDKHGSL